MPSSLMPLLFIVPLLVLLGLLIRQRRRRLPYPPGPKGWPVIGNLGMMDQLTHLGLAKLAKTYGGICHLRLGSLHFVAVSSPEFAKEVLQVQDVVFANRPANISSKYLTYDRADMAFAHYGPFWRQMRKLCVMKLFSRRRAESWDSVRDEVDSAVRFVASNIGSPINIGELMFTVTKNIIYRAAFGSTSREAHDEFVSILQEFSKLFGAFNIADFFPSFTWIDPHGLNPRLAKARQSLDKFIDVVLDDHLKKKEKKKTPGNRSNDEETDMVDELLAFYSEETQANLDSQTAIKLTKDNIKAIIMDVMFGGTETVASAMEWAMAEMMRSPDDMMRVQEELVDVVGLKRRVEESDFEKLAYLKCVFKEILRLHPPIPLLPHETAEDVIVAGYFIPARSRVMINAWAIGRDPGAWEDPDVFKPSRFLKEGAPDYKGSNFEYIPFGSGRRSCPGMQLGVYALEQCVTHLLHCFTWELPDGMKPRNLNMEDMCGLTAPKSTRLVAVPSARLLYPLV